MDKTWSKVLAGCGVGCLLLVAIVVGFTWMGYRWARDATEAVEKAAATERQLIEEYGRVRDYVPPVNILPSADRLEVFLSARENFAPARIALEESVNGIARREGEGGVTGGLRAVRSGVNIPHQIMEFSSARNQSLIDAGMGVGEYTWIYWLSYFAWLGHAADDSEFHEIMEDRSHEGGRVNVHIDGGMEKERIAWRLRRDITAMLRNLQDELELETEYLEQREMVAVELAALADDPARVPWEDGLPAEIAIGLEGYRDRFEASYSKAANPFELIEFD